MYNILAKILRSLAIPIIHKFQPKVIAITGSAGKTSAKEAIFLVLVSKFGKSVIKSTGNLNNELGVPLAILGYSHVPTSWQWPFVLFYLMIKFLLIMITKKYPKILVLEYAADKPGDIKYLTDIARPEIAVITNIGPAHLEKFKSMKNIIYEKMSLAQNMEPEGIAILNKDNKYIYNFAPKIFYQKVFYHGNDLDSASNAAMAVGKIFNISEDKIKKILEKLEPPFGRGKIIMAKNQNIIIDDTYNANPLSMKMAIKKFNGLAIKYKAKRKIICFGDMRELGQDSQKFHKEILTLAKKSVKIIYTVGGEFAITTNGVNNFLHSSDLVDYLKNQHLKNCIILVKGSRAIKMEKVVNLLIN